MCYFSHHNFEVPKIKEEIQSSFLKALDKLNQYTGLGEENKVRSQYLVGT